MTAAMVAEFMQRNDPLQIVGEVRAPWRLALGEGLVLTAIGRRQMIDAGKQRAEEFAIVDDAADRNAAEADAVIAALAADQPGARALAAHVMVRERDFERGVDRFGSGIAEKHPVEPGRRQRRDPVRQLERLRMGELERRRVVEFFSLARDRGHDRIAAVAGIAAPQPGGAVEQGAAIGGVVVHVLGAHDEPRRSFEGAVGRERHPERFEIVGLVRCSAFSCLRHDRLGFGVSAAQARGATLTSASESGSL